MDRIRLNASEWMDFRSGEKKCFLLTNGLGGYCSLTVMGNAARNDQALLMGALKAPTVREHLISNVWETLEVDGEETELFSQEFVRGLKLRRRLGWFRGRIRFLSGIG